MKSNVVEVLFTDACPFWAETLKIINEVVKEFNITIEVKKIRIASEEEAKRYRFPSSPKVRVNGVDIDPKVKETPAYIGCRIYTYKGSIHEYSPEGMIKIWF